MSGGLAASGTTTSYSQRNDEQEEEGNGGEHFLYVLGVIDQLDEDLREMRGFEEEDFFQQKMNLCKELAVEIGDNEDKEEARILLTCYGEITANERFSMLIAK